MQSDAEMFRLPLWPGQSSKSSCNTRKCLRPINCAGVAAGRRGGDTYYDTMWSLQTGGLEHGGVFLQEILIFKVSFKH